MLALALPSAAAPRHDHGPYDPHTYLPEYQGAVAPAQTPEPSKGVRVADNPEETHLKNVMQLTFGGQNAEAYWSKDGRTITYQTLQPGYPDEQIYTMRPDGSGKKLISTGKGRCTCSYVSPDGKWVYFSSTHEKNEGPQKKADMSKGYVWMVNPQFSLYRRNLRDGRLEKVLDENAYVAETTIDPNGRYLTFTSDKDGDLEIYRADLNGKNIKRLTDEPGYDGGPFVSWDGKQIVYRRDTIDTDAELQDYKTLLGEHLVRPSKLEIWIMDADGSHKRQLTHLGAASFAPFMSPDNKRVIFSSNYGDPKGREFDLWAIDVDGHNLERITHTPEFDGFPMWTRDGKKLLWASNRYGKVQGETNLFVADWK